MNSHQKRCICSWAIPCSGTTVYAVRHRAEWLAKIPEPGVRRRGGTVCISNLDLLAAGASRRRDAT